MQQATSPPKDQERSATVSRLAYVKNGDVVLQLERMGDDSPDGGPDAFLADLLRRVNATATLLLSRDRRSALLEQGELRARVVNAFLDGGVLAKLLGKNRAFAMIVRELLAFKPDVVICGALGAPLWASYLAARLTGATFIHSRHVDTANASVPRLLRLAPLLNNRAVRGAHAWVCHGPYTHSQLRALGLPAARIFEFDVGYVPPEGDVDIAQDILAQLSGNPVILYVGRIHPDKGVLDLFEAAAEMLQEQQDLRLVYVGSGPADATLRDMVAQKGLESSVLQVGQVPHADVPGYMRLASVTVTPTRKAQEGRCLTAMESMICGTPVIAPAGGPFPFIVTDEGNGLLYETDSVAGLRNTLKRFFAEQTLRDILVAGAVQSGATLHTPELTFGAAVGRAIQAAADERIAHQKPRSEGE